MAETGVEEKYIEESKNGHLSDAPGMRCYIKCLLEHGGMFEDDGRIHFQEVWHLMTPSMQESATIAVNECETKRKT